MDKQLDSIGDNSRSLYTFYSAKKLYLAHTESRYFLMEKNENSCPKSLSLTTRNAVVISKDGGMLLFPRSK